jgi:glycosyltransferase involved in cell wall biosynthesis
MALAAAERLAGSCELHVSVPNGPLRERFAVHGRILRSSPTMTLGWGTRNRWLAQLARSHLDGIRVAAYIRRHDIGAVYVNSTVLLGPVIGARLAGVPVIVHARELPPDRRARALFAAHAMLADTVVPVSGAVDRGFGPRRRARFVTIYDGILIPPAPPRRAETFHSPLRLCLVGTVGGDGRKGQDIAIAALAQLVAAGVTARLELVGPVTDEDSERALRDQAHALNVGQQVRLLGISDHVNDVIASSDILLSCAREEPLGLTVMEALALERPVVATGVGGVPEIIRDGETGVLVAPEDPAAVAGAIQALLADPDAARAMARRGRQDMNERFARHRGLETLQREFERLLSS